MLLTRLPRPILRPFIKTLWASDESISATSAFSDRERVLPTGMMHLAFRLSSPLNLYDDESDAGKHGMGYAVVGGARSTYYVRDVSEPVSSVAAQLLPGSSQPLFGIPAAEFTERHTSLDDVWGQAASRIREQLLERSSLDERLDVFEATLISRLPRVHGLHPAVAHALDHFNRTADVRKVVKQTGYSHRRFIELFNRAVGLTPKFYCRVLRFQQVIERLAASPGATRVDVALDAGYSDQAHLSREFREFAGITPSEYSKLSPASPNHVPVIRVPR
jgi:AraC-like DNA-binding protein